MKKHFVRLALAFVGFAALAITAKAQASDQVIINIPYQFVVAGTTMPAGTYRVSRVSDINTRELLLSSFENRTAVLVLPVEVENVSSEKTSFTFAHVGGQYFLTKIKTADHTFAIPASNAAILQAAAKSHQGSATSGVSGTD
jgi:hypothetical protein